MALGGHRVFAFIQLVTTGVAGDEFRKNTFARDGRAILRELAKLLSLPKGSYNIRYNRAGIGSSGDVILHGEWLYVCFTADTTAGLGFMYRSRAGQRDYAGGTNQWLPWDALLNLPVTAQVMARCMSTNR